MRQPRIGCVMLAAGFGRRFGADKRRALLPDGTPLLTHTLRAAAPAFSERVLVLREEDEDLRKRHADWPCVIATDAALGLGHSLAAALPHIEDWDGMVVALGDMPWVQTRTYAQIKQRLAPELLVVPYYQGQRGNPVGIGSDFFPELMKPQGDQGARTLFKRHSSSLVACEVDDAGILRDVDSPQDLR
jgi:Uncharacterized MobA-related protein